MPDGYGAGFYTALIWAVNVNGYATGDQTTLAINTTAHARLLRDVRTGNLAYTEPTNLDIQGGDKNVATFQFGNYKLGSFDLVVSNIDSALIAFLAAAAQNTVNSYYTWFTTNPNLTNPFTVGLALIQRFQNKAVGADGPDQYHSIIIPRAVMRARMGGFGFQAGADVTFRVTPTLTDKAPNGQSFATGANNLAMAMEEDRADHIDLISQNPIHITTFRANGVATTFNTAYTPVSNVVTLNATPNLLTINGVPTALASLVTTTKVATLAVAGASGDYDVLIYQTARYAG